jgi:hypothetical protein
VPGIANVTDQLISLHIQPDPPALALLAIGIVSNGFALGIDHDVGFLRWHRAWVAAAKRNEPSHFIRFPN